VVEELRDVVLATRGSVAKAWADTSQTTSGFAPVHTPSSSPSITALC
jgi:hypothetical protein